MTRRVLTSLRLDKIAAVDAPCQEHASADILKRDFTQDERDAAAKSGAALPDGSFPIHTVDDLHNAIRAIGRAKDEVAAKAHIISRAKSLGASDQLPQDWSTTKANPGNKLETKMLKELAKALGLPETATETDVSKAIADNIAKIATVTEALAKAEVLAKMSDKHKAHADTLSGDAKDKFMAMDNDAKDAACAKSAPDIEKAVRDGDAFRTPEGVLITKAKVGDELFSVLKSQNERITKQAEDLAKAREDSELADFSKRAATIGFGAEFGPTLRKAYRGDSAAQTEVENRIAGLQKQAEEGGVFKNFGRNGPASDAETEFMAKVDEVKKANPKLSDAQAYSKAYTDRSNAAIVKRMKTEADA